MTDRAKPKLFLAELSHSDYLDVIRRGLQVLGVSSKWRQETRVFIKPNLTFPVFRPGVMTSPACVEALIIALKDYTSNIVVGEADSGGYNRFSIDDVQERIGLKAFESKYGIRVVNLSRMARRDVDFKAGDRRLSFPFPLQLLDETDVIVSAAVPKIHMNTLVSMTLKNLWGCIPDPPARLKLHPYLDRVLQTIVQGSKSTIAVIDGRYGLNRSGPMLGDAVELNWLLMSDNLYAADKACCRLMQIDPERVYYLKSGDGKNPAPDMNAIQTDRPWQSFLKEKFYLRRAWTDYPGLWAFRSPWLSYLFYFSPLAGILHRILYLFRKPFYDYDDPGRTKK